MEFQVTPIFALASAVIYLILWMRVTSMRSNMGVSIGDNGDAGLRQRVRQHGNCAEWSAFILILMILAEGMGAPALYLYITGVLFIIGRVAHPFGLKADNVSHPLRYVGNGTNILATLNIMICLVINLVSS